MLAVISDHTEPNTVAYTTGLLLLFEAVWKQMKLRLVASSTKHFVRHEIPTDARADVRAGGDNYLSHPLSFWGVINIINTHVLTAFPVTDLFYFNKIVLEVSETYPVMALEKSNLRARLSRHWYVFCSFDFLSQWVDLHPWGTKIQCLCSRPYLILYYNFFLLQIFHI